MKKLTHSYLRQIDEAILEYKIMSCPEMTCNHKLTSYEYIAANNQPVMEYWCTNEDCQFHSKRKIILQSSTQNSIPENVPVVANSFLSFLPKLFFKKK